MLNIMDVEKTLRIEPQAEEKSVTPNFCRICLNVGATIPIFESTGPKCNDIQRKIYLCFGEEISDINGYPRNICRKCHNTVNETVVFINKYKESCKKIKAIFEFVDDKNFSNDESKYFNITEPEIQIIQISGRGVSNASTQYEYPFSDNHFNKTKRIPLTRNKVKAQKIISNEKSNTIIQNNEERNEPELKDNQSELTSTDERKKQTREVKPEIEIPRKKTKRRKIQQLQPRKIKVKKEKEPPSLEPTCCEYCGKEYTNRSLLSRHIRIHHDLEKPHQCPTCSKFFSEQKLLKRHIRRVHSGEKNCICSECGRGFVGLSELGSHYKSSHIKKPCPKIYGCKFCGKMYTTAKSAVTHERAVHTGERPAACTICDARFTHDDYLKIHMRLHTGETPFTCPICPKAFSQSGNMKSHIRHNHSISQTDPEIMKTLNSKYLKYMKP